MTSMSPPPRRRFLPQPVETSARSSKRPHPTSPDRTVPELGGKANLEPMAASTKPRRFLPQPVEESVRSSRKKNVDHSENTTTRQQAAADDDSKAGESSQTPVKPVGRRFAPQPVETTARSSRRKFAPEPIEVSSRSTKSKAAAPQETSPPDRARRKFAVEPVETSTTKHRRRKQTDDSSNDSPSESSSDNSSKVSSRRSTGSRKFTPELIEVARGEFRQGRKDSDTHDSSHSKASSPQTPKNHDSTEITESRFSAAALAKRQHEEHRRHSYCIPNLPMIESDSSGEDSSFSPNPSRSSSEHDLPKLEKIPEVQNTSYLDYVLSLADRKKLQEQAMAAYINEVPHEPVSHFAAEDETDDDHHGVMSGKEGADPQTFRRSSQDELDLEMSSMRKHHEQLERAKKDLANDTAGASRFSAAALAARHHLNIGHPKPAQQEQETHKKHKAVGSDYANMRAAASPPMLGNDIVFPFTISPKMTRCDVDQAPRPRRADSDDEEKPVQTGTSLWTASVTVQNNAGAGLWMGLCQKGPEDNTRPETPIKSGLQTPAFEGPNPFELWSPLRGGAKTPGRRPGPKPLSDRAFLSVTPPRTPDAVDEFTSSIDKKLELEKTIEEEFPNSVVTQIYNYLSLGYPSLARSFDEELSKISRISVEELRRDDQVAAGNVKGYVGAPEGAGNWQMDDQEALRGCRRWEALRLYVKEWARQSPTFASERSTRPCVDRNKSGLSVRRAEAWGATARRGSWAQ